MIEEGWGPKTGYIIIDDYVIWFYSIMDSYLRLPGSSFDDLKFECKSRKLMKNKKSPMFDISFDVCAVIV